MVCIIDYGLGNIGSLINMFKYINQEVIVSSDQSKILNASHLILPGVGTFDTGMKNLQKNNLTATLNNAVIKNKIPILGICLGAQLMLESSEEGIEKGLNWVDGNVVKFNTNEKNIKIPHMGWNNVKFEKNHWLFSDMPDENPRFYFVHSYHFNIFKPNQIAGETSYGINFASGFVKENIVGVQFHPEKSHLFGMQLLRNFIKHQ